MQVLRRLHSALMAWLGTQWHLRHRAGSGVIWLHQRPLFCLLAGLVAGSVFGSATAVSPPFIIAMPMLCIVVWRRWTPVPLRHCCRFLLAGFLLAHLHLAWTQRALPLNHIARIRLQQPHQRLHVEGHLYRAVELDRKSVV